MAAFFPGGIFDSQRNLAFVRLADGEIVAVQLSTGQVKWRKPNAGRPIGITDQGLVVISPEDGRVAVSILDSESGAVRRTIADVPIPSWVAPEIHSLDAFAATAADSDGGIEVHWKARELYREGTARASRPGGAKEHSGRVTIPVDRDIALAAAGNVPGSASQTAEPSFELPAEAHDGDRSLSLESVAAGPAETSVVLRLRDRSGSLIWQNEIKRLSSKGPPRLRM